MANKYSEKCSTSLVIRKLHNETTIISQFTPTEMAIIKIQTITRVEKLELQYTTDGNVRAHSCCGKLFASFLRKLNSELPYDPAVLLLGVSLRELKTCVHTHTYFYTHSQSSIIHNSPK